MPPDVENARRRLADIVRRDRRYLVRFARSKLSKASESDAEDVVSDLVLRLFERADLLAEVENLTAYLLRALAHGAIDLVRRRREVEPLPLDRADPAPDPEATLRQAQLRARLQVALAQLPPAQQAVWVAVEIEGATFRDLARAWNEPIGTLLSRKSRATKALRVWLAEDNPDQ